MAVNMHNELAYVHTYCTVMGIAQHMLFEPSGHCVLQHVHHDTVSNDAVSTDRSDPGLLAIFLDPMTRTTSLGSEMTWKRHGQ